MGLILVIGHCFPVWLKFKGGKGVATTFGVYCGINPLFGAVFAVIWLIVAFALRYSSLAALCAVIITPLFIIYNNAFSIPLLCITYLVLIRHHDNIKRLINGTESKISFGGNKK
jgi:glycerol-3-phosphate acyltransferase PlsY